MLNVTVRPMFLHLHVKFSLTLVKKMFLVILVFKFHLC